jgi:hypothetical protein
MINQKVTVLEKSVMTKSHKLRKLAALIQKYGTILKYGTRPSQIYLTDGEDIVEALRFQADALENAAHVCLPYADLQEKASCPPQSPGC